MPHFPTHNPLKKELNLENIYQKLPIGIELYDKEGNLIDTTNEINIREKLHAAEQEQRPALTADQRYSRFLQTRIRGAGTAVGGLVGQGSHRAGGCDDRAAGQRQGPERPH